MKKQLIISTLVLTGFGIPAIASYYAGFSSPAYEDGRTISSFIYASGSGYSPSTQPLKWQSAPPTTATAWITNDANQTNIKSSKLLGSTDGTVSWGATGGVYDSTAPATRRTELWHPLKINSNSNRIHFSVYFKVMPSSSNRAEDTFGWAFKNLSGEPLFQILFKPGSANTGRCLEVWEYDRNGVGKPTSLTVQYGQPYNLFVNFNEIRQSYTGILSSSKQTWNFSGMAGDQAGRNIEKSPKVEASASSDDSKIASIAAVWILNGTEYGNNYMAFTAYHFVNNPNQFYSDKNPIRLNKSSESDSSPDNPDNPDTTPTPTASPTNPGPTPPNPFPTITPFPTILPPTPTPPPNSF